MGEEKENDSKPKIRVIFKTTQGTTTDIEVFLELQLINFWKNI